MSCVTFLTTLTFFATTQDLAEPIAGGFPAIPAASGQFLLKGVVLLTASLLLASVLPEPKTLRAGAAPRSMTPSHVD